MSAEFVLKQGGSAPFESLLFSILLVFSASGSGSIPSINIFLSRALLSMAGFRWSSKKSVSPEGKSLETAELLLQEAIEVEATVKGIRMTLVESWWTVEEIVL